MNHSRIVRSLAQVMALSVVFASACKGPEPHATSSEHAHQGGTKPVAQEQIASGPVNAKCPIMGGTVDADGELASFNGKTIGFCCPGCKPKWEAWETAKKAEFVSASVKK